VTTLTALAVLLLATASVYATVKAFSAVCRLDLLSWMCWNQIGTAAGELLSALVRSATDD
jgi:hypothetical protein